MRVRVRVGLAAVDVHVYDARELGVAFEAESAGALVVVHGRAELR